MEPTLPPSSPVLRLTFHSNRCCAGGTIIPPNFRQFPVPLARSPICAGQSAGPNCYTPAEEGCHSGASEPGPWVLLLLTLGFVATKRNREERLNPTILRVLVTGILLFCWVPTGVCAEESGPVADDRELSAPERKWLGVLLPSAEPTNPLPRDIQHALGNRLLPRSLGGQPWFVYSLQLPEEVEDIAQIGLLILEGDRMRKGPIHYPIGSDVLLGIPFLMKNGSFSQSWISPFFWTAIPFWSLPGSSLKKVTLWALEEVVQRGGILHRHRLYFRKQKETLRITGSVPILAKMSGSAAVWKERSGNEEPWAEEEMFPALPLATTVEPSRRGLTVQEHLSSSRHPRFRLKERKNRVLYRWTGKRLQPNRKSLWARIPEDS